MSQFQFVDELPGAPYRPVRSPNRFIKPSAQLLIDFADALRAHPMTWAVWPRPLATPNTAGVTSKRIREGFYRAVRPGGGFEAAYREGVVYVRFNPDRVDDDRDLAFREGYEAGRKQTMKDLSGVVERTFRQARAEVGAMKGTAKKSG